MHEMDVQRRVFKALGLTDQETQERSGYFRSIIYPVTDPARAKTLFRTLLGIEPYSDDPSYVGFLDGEQLMDLDPNGRKAGMTVYYQVDDIKRA